MIYRTDSTLIFCVSSSIKFVYIKTDFKNEIPNVRSESMPNMHSNKWAHSTFHHLKCDFSIVLKSNRLTCVLSSMQSIHLCNNNKTLEKHFKNSKWINLNHMDQWVWEYGVIWFFHLLQIHFKYLAHKVNVFYIEFRLFWTVCIEVQPFVNYFDYDRNLHIWQLMP